MSRWSGDVCTSCFGMLQQQPQGGGPVLVARSSVGCGRKVQKMFLSGSKDKDKPFSRICICMPIRVGMLLLASASAAVLVIILTVFRGCSLHVVPSVPPTPSLILQYGKGNAEEKLSPPERKLVVFQNNLRLKHPCEGFFFPPPPADPKRRGPRPCPVCYVPVEYAIAIMPAAPSISPVIKNLTYLSGEDSSSYGSISGSRFGGHPTLRQRNEYFDIKESMSVHCGFLGGDGPGNGTGFDIKAADLFEMQQCRGVVVASAIFGNYDIMQQPKNISEAAKESVCFYMFVDEETESYIKNSNTFSSAHKVGIWRLVVVKNLPYSDARRNGKIPKLLLHRIFPNAQYSLWIDGKLELVVDPYQVLERFLWRKNATFAISRHYRRFDVFEEAEANKVAGKYDNASIDRQIDFYKSEGLTHYSPAKLPITSDVPEGCVIIREHTPISDLFSCLWFNEVDRFTSRDQLSFSTVRDKIQSKVNWTVEMFMDCERRNFVVQGYHRDILEQKRAATASSPKGLTLGSVNAIGEAREMKPSSRRWPRKFATKRKGKNL